MDLLQKIILALSIILEAIILYRILAYKQYHVCRMFFFYIISLLIPSILIMAFYKMYYSDSREWQLAFLIFLAVKNHLQNLLKFAVIYEMYQKIYTPYPGAKRILLPFLLLTLPLLLYYIIHTNRYSDLGTWWNIYAELDSRVILVITLQFIILAGGVSFFNLKIHRTLKWIILGFLLYQGPRSILVLMATVFGEDFGKYVEQFAIVSYAHQLLIIPVLFIWIMAYLPPKKVQ